MRCATVAIALAAVLTTAACLPLLEPEKMDDHVWYVAMESSTWPHFNPVLPGCLTKFRVTYSAEEKTMKFFWKIEQSDALTFNLSNSDGASTLSLSGGEDEVSFVFLHADKGYALALFHWQRSDAAGVLHHGTFALARLTDLSISDRYNIHMKRRLNRLFEGDSHYEINGRKYPAYKLEEPDCWPCEQFKPAKKVDRTAFVGVWYPTVLNTFDRDDCSPLNRSYNPQDKTIRQESLRNESSVPVVYVEGVDGVDKSTSPLKDGLDYVTLLSSDKASNSWIAVHHCYSSPYHPLETRYQPRLIVYSRTRRLSKDRRRKALRDIKKAIKNDLDTGFRHVFMKLLWNNNCYDYHY